MLIELINPLQINLCKVGQLAPTKIDSVELKLRQVVAALLDTEQVSELLLSTVIYIITAC